MRLLKKYKCVQSFGIQLQDERLSTIDRDNCLLASKLAHIVHSKGLLDHQNQYHLRRLVRFPAVS